MTTLWDSRNDEIIPMVVVFKNDAQPDTPYRYICAQYSSLLSDEMYDSFAKNMQDSCADIDASRAGILDNVLQYIVHDYCTQGSDITVRDYLLPVLRYLTPNTLVYLIALGDKSFNVKYVTLEDIMIDPNGWKAEIEASLKPYLQFKTLEEAMAAMTVGSQIWKITGYCGEPMSVKYVGKVTGSLYECNKLRGKFRVPFDTGDMYINDVYGTYILGYSCFTSQELADAYLAKAVAAYSACHEWQASCRQNQNRWYAVLPQRLRQFLSY